jgi:hypothetical protein
MPTGFQAMHSGLYCATCVVEIAKAGKRSEKVGRCALLNAMGSQPVLSWHLS